MLFLDKVQRGELPAQDVARPHLPVPLEQRRLVGAKIHGKGHVSFPSGGPAPVPRHGARPYLPPHQGDVGGPVVVPPWVLACPATELGVGRDDGRIQRRPIMPRDRRESSPSWRSRFCCRACW